MTNMIVSGSAVFFMNHYLGGAMKSLGAKRFQENHVQIMFTIWIIGTFLYLHG
jgi:hypothetical protein